MFGRGILWRNLGAPVRLGPLDGRATFFLLLFMYHWAIWTFVLCTVGTLALFIMERYDYTIPNIVRRFQVLIVGNLRPRQASRRLRSDV